MRLMGLVAVSLTILASHPPAVGAGWALLFRQTGKGLRPAPASAWAADVAADDPDAEQFSILPSLGQRHGPGPYSLKLLYPKELPGEQQVCSLRR